MANTDKNIVITPNIGQTSDPKIEFRGADASTGPQTITLTAYPTNSGTISFDGSAGQLFSITNSLSGTLFSVNDVSGIPSIEVVDTGLIKLGQYSGNVLLGTANDEGAKLHINGGASMTGSWNRSMTLRATYPTIVLNSNDTKWAGIGYDHSSNLIIRVGATSADVFGSGNPALTANASTGVINLTQTGATVNNNTILHAGNYSSYVLPLSGGTMTGAISFAAVQTWPTFNQNTTGTAASTPYPVFSGDAVDKANITTRVDTGFYQTDTGTLAEGWPTNSGGWHHLISCTHSNDSNYYAMQLASTFDNQNLYFRATSGSGTTAWSKIWSDANDGASSGLDADLLDGNHASAFYLASNPNGYTSNTGTVTSVGGTGTVSGLSLSGTVTTSGNLTLSGTLSVTPGNFASQTANTILAAPDGAAGTPSFRALASADITSSALGSGTASSSTYLRGDRTWATIAGGAAVSNDTTTNASYYPMWTTSTSGTPTTVYVSSTKLYFNPSAGTLNATIFNSLSDAALKTNIAHVDSATSTLKQIEGVSFNWKDSGKKSYGVIAQEIEKILPDIVDTSDQGVKSVNYAAMTAFFIEAIKELSEEIEQLKRNKLHSST